MNKLKRKYALVTGATSGIGFSITKKLVQEGVYVFAASRSLKNKSEFTSWLGGVEANKSCEFVPCDLMKNEGVEELFSLLEKNSSISIISLCAGNGALNNTESLDIEKVMNLNLFSSWKIISFLLKQDKSDSETSLLLFSSTSSFKPMPSQVTYHVSKMALNSLFRSVFSKLKKRNIYATLVIPSSVDTPFWNGVKEKRRGFLTPEYVSSKALASLAKRRKYCLVGFKSKLQYYFFLFMPWGLTDWLVSFRESRK